MHILFLDSISNVSVNWNISFYFFWRANENAGAMDAVYEVCVCVCVFAKRGWLGDGVGVQTPTRRLVASKQVRKAIYSQINTAKYTNFMASSII